MRRFSIFFVSLFMVSLLAVPVYADVDELISGVQEVVPTPDPASESGGSEAGQDVTVNVDVPVYYYDNGAINYVSDSDVEVMAAYDIYPGTWSGSVLEYFTGVMRKHPGVHYVAFRADNYNYYLYYGSELSASGNQVSGTGDYLHYNSYTGSGYSQYLERGSGSVSINLSSGFGYTDLVSDCAELEGVTSVNIQTLIIGGLVVMLGLWVLSRIFWRGLR